MRLVHAITMADLNNGFNLAAAYNTYTQIGSAPLFMANNGTINVAALVSDGIRTQNYPRFAIQGGPAARQLKPGEVITFGFYLYPYLSGSPVNTSSGSACQVGSTRGTYSVINYNDLSAAMDGGRASFIEVSINKAGTEAKVWVNGVLTATQGVNVDMETLTFYTQPIPNSRYVVYGEFYMAIFDPVVEAVYLGRWKCENLKLDSSEFKDVSAYDLLVDDVGKVPKSSTFSYVGVNPLLGAVVLCAIKTPFSYTLVAEATSGERTITQESINLPGWQIGSIPAVIADGSFPVASVPFDNDSKQLVVKLSVKE